MFAFLKLTNATGSLIPKPSDVSIAMRVEWSLAFVCAGPLDTKFLLDCILLRFEASAGGSFWWLCLWTTWRSQVLYAVHVSSKNCKELHRSCKWAVVLLLS